MGRFFGKGNSSSKKDEEARSEREQVPNYSDAEFQKRDLFKKGQNYMSNDKMLDAVRCFELALRIDPKYVDAWVKKGYAHFHMSEYTVAISSYDRALEVDVNNAEAWNLKGLAYYKLKNHEKAIECCEKAIDIDPNDGMAWYNRACYLTLSGKVDEGLESLKRSIEIDIANARKAVKDRDFENARAEEGFRRIIEVVVLESIRQGYDYVGKIVWLTGIDKIEVEDAIMRLTMKGLLTKREKRNITGMEEYYEITRDIAAKIGVTKRVGLFGKEKQVSAPVQQLKDISEVLGKAKEAVEHGDLEATKQCFDELISPAKHGSAMIEQFFEEHRDLRLAQIKLRDRGQEYLNANKAAMIDMIGRIDMKVRQGPVTKPAKD
ncbi:TPR repeat [Candidatus Nitrososphaera evergladensis SR1]|uniref:TPR repeat n=1 Tax=Candidatus Nitrososphaera evergladensis SR1 TaxID=1459636 RepID=A0A075MSZ5_9ARCH|nr:tetratricopeptide repeat protein [Candidatus Nitrososphaera evergladensis]AIF84315.1 TPR repeat [Candidatus Nitrososphaera evergladensis SR1]